MHIVKTSLQASSCHLGTNFKPDEGIVTSLFIEDTEHVLYSLTVNIVLLPTVPLHHGVCNGRELHFLRLNPQHQRQNSEFAVLRVPEAIPRSQEAAILQGLRTTIAPRIFAYIFCITLHSQNSS